jgi:hypothetical protein
MVDLRFFDYEHLPERLQTVSRPIGDLAREMARTLPDNAERAAGLRKLLEAKDCLVRAALAMLMALLLAPPAAAQESIYEHIPHLRLAALREARVIEPAAAAQHARSTALLAADPSPAPLLSPSSANGDPFEVSVTIGGLVTFGSDAQAEVTPTAYVEAEGPLVVGELPLGRIGARVGLSTAPGETLDISDPATFEAGDISLWAGRIIGRRITKDADGLVTQDVTTAAVFDWGFSSRIDKGEQQPRDRLTRHYGAGLRFQERHSGASLTALYGRDEAAGDRGYGQWLIWGSLPIPATKGTVVLVADATLSVGPAGAGEHQRDVFRAGIVVDLAQVVGAVADR